MELIRGIHNLRSEHHGCVLTIGNFDGVHLGHQAVLAQVKAQARALGVAAAVMTFEPQPQEIFQPEKAPARLTNWREKYLALRDQQIDRHLVIEFNRKFASQPPIEFIENVLVEKLGVKFLVVGDDFRFGYKREGDFALLQREGKRLGFEVVDTRSYRQQQLRVSSTAIRAALAEGDFERAESMLGRPYQMMGKIVHGRKNGRTIGFPTANIPLKRLKSPLHGVFAVKINVGRALGATTNSRAEGTYHGVANLGTRPTLNGDEVQLEVHLFDFSGNLYGQHATVTPVAKLRSEQRFASLEHLKQQIEKDAARARALLS
ncbi:MULTISPECIES: bifunctional riboflavin kinase/FAD synthetase [Idiomarina]|uniref:Riboflavin biosynthesis protein n=2 Tax=Idiomarina baltica TaxID=190892 RepID=A0ABM9WLL5_9GAMM|nr:MULTISPECIES: bifunctional riboflavin kinase/FAD synthetase [Idiomarina]MBL73851.1 bifunctional riboflavin kinase/FAD synthetase [Idiomarinaceae bacterium]MBR38044.1 bifunctional riboflavin kinase/FAD synthetase [Idiomarina sp.]MEC8925543.1 bifunctional riboflavin kinase/FAD synthetase [Pseudomonadota bacterium]EAQ31850.1 FAD synthase [Idiomarina baltica OS145]KXS35244.1 MAG: FAD synthase [Idiomarina sp. T82-3]